MTLVGCRTFVTSGPCREYRACLEPMRWEDKVYRSYLLLMHICSLSLMRISDASANSGNCQPFCSTANTLQVDGSERKRIGLLPLVMSTKLASYCQKDPLGVVLFETRGTPALVDTVHIPAVLSSS